MTRYDSTRLAITRQDAFPMVSFMVRKPGVLIIPAITDDDYEVDEQSPGLRHSEPIAVEVRPDRPSVLNQPPARSRVISPASLIDNIAAMFS